MKNIGIFLLYFVISIAILVLSVVGINTGNGMDNFVFWFILQICFTIIFFIAIFVKEIIKPNNDIDANVKNAPEEFKKILNYMQERNLLDSEASRIKLYILSKIRLMSIAILVIAFVVVFGSEGDIEGDFLKYTLFAGIGAGAVLFFTKEIYKTELNEYEFIYKKEVIPTMLSLMNPNFKYVPTDLKKQEEYEELYERSSFTPALEAVFTEDYIEGYAVADTYMRLCDAEVVKLDSEEAEYTTFQGLFANFSGIHYEDHREITITTDTKELMSRIDTYHEKFNKSHKIYSSNTLVCDRMVKEGLCDAVLKLEEEYQCLFDITIRHGEVFIRTHVGNTFEPKINDTSKGVQPLYEHYRKFKLLFDVFYMVKSYIE